MQRIVRETWSKHLKTCTCCRQVWSVGFLKVPVIGFASFRLLDYRLLPQVTVWLYWELATPPHPPHHISTQTTFLFSAELSYFKSVNKASCKCLVPSQLLHSSTSQLILLLLGYTGDLTVALEPPECLGPASEDSLQSGEYLTSMSPLLS